MAELQAVAYALSQANQPNQPPITLGQIVHFLVFSSRLKNEILLVQPGYFDIVHMRPVLSPSLQEFLAAASQIPVGSINIIWSALANTAWNLNLDITPASTSTLRSIFVGHGYSRGYSKKLINTSLPHSTYILL